MKTIKVLGLWLTAAGTAMTISVASAQEKKAPMQPAPMPASAVKVQQQTHSPAAEKKTDAATGTKRPATGKAAPSHQVDNKIAVSDPGAPADKSNNTKRAIQPVENKKNNKVTGVSPK